MRWAGTQIMGHNVDRDGWAERETGRGGSGRDEQTRRYECEGPDDRVCERAGGKGRDAHERRHDPAGSLDDSKTRTEPRERPNVTPEKPQTLTDEIAILFQVRSDRPRHATDKTPP